MKAETKKTRWFLIALLFGFLAAAALTLAHHHGSRTVAKANAATAPKHTVRQQTHAALLAAIGGKHTFRIPAGAGPELTANTYSNTMQPHATGHSAASWNTATGAATATGWSNPDAGPAAGSGNATPAPGNRPAAFGSHLPQDLAGGLAYNLYSPLDCELPAGCGATGGTNPLSRQPSGTSNGAPFAHDSGSTQTNDRSTPGTNNDSGNTGGNTGNTTGNTKNTDDPSDPSNPGSNPVASAPELDPATLAGAVTLLLGGLVVLRSRRRVRVTTR